MPQSKALSIAIFGASSGIALATAQRLAAAAPHFYLLGRDRQKLEDIEKDLLARGAQSVVLIEAELGTAAAATAATAELLALCPRIDLALLAHGVLGEQSQLLSDWQACEKLLAVNILAPIAILHQLRPRFLAQKSGQIAVLSSVAGDRGRFSNYVYGSSKAALTAYCSGLRAELSHAGVGLLTIKPGMVATAMTAHIKPGLLMGAASTVARDICRALDRGRDQLYTPWFWAPIMLIVRLLPESIFKKLRF